MNKGNEMSLAPITLETELETTDDNYEVGSITLPQGSTGQVLKVEDGRVLVEWSYCFSNVPWATEYYISEWIDLDDWSAWVILGFEEPEEG